MKKDILTLIDLDNEDFEAFFERAFELKKSFNQGTAYRPLEGKTLGLLFDKPSTRTRVSFEAAMVQLGGTPIFINARDTQISRNEPVRDTARVLTRFIDGLAIRTFSQDFLNEFARFTTISVINALTDLYHPCQVLSDIMTIIEVKGGYKGVKIAWVGDGNNVSQSWINAAAVLGLKLSLACPKGFMPKPDILDKALSKNNGEISISSDPNEAVENADVIYTDVWASMGQEGEQSSRKPNFMPFQVNSRLLARAAKDAVVMHCLPAHRGEEITGEVLEGPQSIVWDQSENKMHMHKALLEILILNSTDRG